MGNFTYVNFERRILPQVEMFSPERQKRMSLRDQKRPAAAEADYANALRGSDFSQNERMEFYLEDWSGSRGPAHLHVDIETYEDSFTRADW